MADQVFTSGQILTAAQMTTLQSNSGLVPMGTYTNSATTTLAATLCFTSSFVNYRLVFTATGGSTSSPDVTCTLDVGATPTASAYTNIINFNSSAAGPSRAYTAAGANFTIGSAGASASAFTCDIFKPQAAAPSSFISNYVGIGSVTSFAALSMGSQNSNNQHTGFTLTCASTFTGSVTVYAYR